MIDKRVSFVKRIEHDPKFGVYKITLHHADGDYVKSHVHDDFGNLVPTSALKVVRYGLLHSH